MKISHLFLASLLSLLFFSISFAQNTKLPNDEGIVVTVLDTTGYTYMELENGDRHFWIAAPTTKVKVGDHIRFVESMAMTNFSSKTLDRTFPRIIFVSSTLIKK
ncbi:MAG: hypothetical protein NMNS01_17950 [Nitrosomonas sp.]|jgi:hypothetical protein|nr:MAG: hypothetical protein NMNS01_17950 [Nitrosomonas sp.]